MESPKIRIPPNVLMWLMEQQQPRESIGRTLERILAPKMKAESNAE